MLEAATTKSTIHPAVVRAVANQREEIGHHEIAMLGYGPITGILTATGADGTINHYTGWGVGEMEEAGFVGHGFAGKP